MTDFDTIEYFTGNRQYSCDPTFLLRGLSELHLTFTPVSE
jgi:hypothetical protein